MVVMMSVSYPPCRNLFSSYEPADIFCCMGIDVELRLKEFMFWIFAIKHIKGNGVCWA